MRAWLLWRVGQSPPPTPHFLEGHRQTPALGLGWGPLRMVPLRLCFALDNTPVHLGIR